MSGISSKAASTLQNNYKYNEGTELNSTFDVNLYETLCRGYDPQIGRFHQIDAFADLLSSVTPFQFGFNNPILYNDPLGLSPDNINDVVNQLFNSPFGGSWSASGGIGYFNSDAQAFEAGAAIWHNTTFGVQMALPILLNLHKTVTMLMAVKTKTLEIHFVLFLLIPLRKMVE